MPRNVAPSVSAGPDQTTLAAVASLSGSVTDDGRPLGNSLTSVWSLVSGPAPVVFGDPASPRTEVQFVLAGTYVLRLTATDTELAAIDEVTIAVVPSLSIADARVTEGHSGLTEVGLQVVLSVASPDLISVEFLTADGTAFPGCDYLPRVGAVRFAPGETSHEIIVPVVGELDAEEDETVFVRLGNVTGGAVLARAESTVTITNDDAPNQPPSAIAGRSPADGATGLPLNPPLSWTSSDPDGTAVTHDVYFGTEFSTTGQTWTRLCSAGNGPGPRAAAGTAYDEDRRSAHRVRRPDCRRRCRGCVGAHARDRRGRDAHVVPRRDDGRSERPPSGDGSVRSRDGQAHRPRRMQRRLYVSAR